MVELLPILLPETEDQGGEEGQRCCHADEDGRPDRKRGLAASAGGQIGHADAEYGRLAASMAAAARAQSLTTRTGRAAGRARLEAR